MLKKIQNLIKEIEETKMPTIKDLQLPEEHIKLLKSENKIKSLNKTFLEEMKNCNEKCCKCNRNAHYLNKTNDSLLCWNHSVNL